MSKEAALKEYEDGEVISVIAAKYGASETTIRRWASKAGLAQRGRGNSDKNALRGGRWVRNGYGLKVWVSDDAE